MSIKRGVTIKDVISGLSTCQSKYGAIHQVKMSCFPPAYFGFSFGFHRTLRWIILGPLATVLGVLLESHNN